jgi:DNA-binding response OmpR family regulator
MSKRILVVDDEAVVLGAVSKALRKTDYHIDTVQSSEEALDRLSEASYDVVLTDLMMPGIDGLGLMQRMRDMGADTQTIMITGYPTIKTALRAKRIGAFEYVTKPFTRQELLSVVVRALRRGDSELTRSKESASSISTGTVYFLPEHAWVKLEPDRTARIGMAPEFASTVGEVVDLELPDEDALIEQGRYCVVVRAEDGVEHYLHAPLSGRVVEVNRELQEDPELAVRDPGGEGWLLRVEPQDPDREIENLVPAG